MQTRSHRPNRDVNSIRYFLVRQLGSEAEFQDFLHFRRQLENGSMHGFDLMFSLGLLRSNQVLGQTNCLAAATCLQRLATHDGVQPRSRATEAHDVAASNQGSKGLLDDIACSVSVAGHPKRVRRQFLAMP